MKSLIDILEGVVPPMDNWAFVAQTLKYPATKVNDIKYKYNNSSAIDGWLRIATRAIGNEFKIADTGIESKHNGGYCIIVIESPKCNNVFILSVGNEGIWINRADSAGSQKETSFYIDDMSGALGLNNVKNVVREVSSKHITFAVRGNYYDKIKSEMLLNVK